MKNSIKTKYLKFFIIGIASIFALYLSELILTLIYKIHYVSEPDKKYVNDDINTTTITPNVSKFETYNALKKNNYNIYMSLFPKILVNLELENKKILREIFPLGGIPNVKTLLCNESEGPVIYEADNDGFRNNKKNNNYDLTLLGDSFTQGVCVNEGIAENLSKSGLKVYNLGMQGNGPLSVLASYKEYNRKSKYVIYVYHENDLDDLNYEKKTFLKNYLIDNFSQHLKLKSIKISKLLIKMHNHELSNLLQGKNKNSFSIKKDSKKIYDFLLLKKIRRLVKSFTVKNNNNDSDDLLLMKLILQKLKYETEKNNQKLLFVFTPELSRIYLRKDDNFKNRGKLLAILKEFQIPLIDFTPIALIYDYETIYDTKGTNHYSKFGYKLLSDEVLKKIKY